jgi:hypothetical protein
MKLIGKMISIILCLMPAVLSAQESSHGFTVNSSPPGAEVSLIGLLTVSGLTPVSFTQGLEGNYRVTIKKHGYETYKSSIFLQPDRSLTLTARLRPKTRFKAAARSLIIPGWGQSYSGQKFKGLCFTLMAGGAITAFLLTDSDFHDKDDKYKATLDKYNSAENYQEKISLYSLVGITKNDAYHAENRRRISIGMTAGVWALSILDIFFFFPEDNGSVLVNTIGIKPDLENGGALVVLNHHF